MTSTTNIEPPKTAHFFVGLQKFIALRTTTYVSQKFLCPPRIALVFLGSI